MAFPAQAQTTNICDRTPQVVDAILLFASAENTCDNVPVSLMASFVALSLGQKNITSLQSGDFAGLPNVGQIDLRENQLTDLPATIFNDIPNLMILAVTGTNVGSLPNTIFSSLNKLHSLHLHTNKLTRLPAGIFSDLSSLQLLRLHNNSITNLPESIFSGLSGGGLHTLHLPHETDNSGVFTLTLEWERADGSANEKQATLKLKMREDFGAPFRMNIPISVRGATANPGSLQIAAGANESGEITVTREANAKDFEVTPQTPNFPNNCTPLLRPCYRGFRPGQPSKIPTFRVGEESICDRTPQVRDEILRLISTDDISCENVLPSELAAVSAVNLQDKGITSLKPGDFEGFTGLTSLNLSSNPNSPFRLEVHLQIIVLGTPESFTVDAIKLVMPIGAPRSVTMPVMIAGGTPPAGSLTIPEGDIESARLKITRNEGTFQIRTGEITLGGNDDDFSGFNIVEGSRLSTIVATALRVKVFLEGALE